MMSTTSYTIEELASILKVSKLTVYDLIKKGTLPAYRVGRQMRVDEEDLTDYKNQTKNVVTSQKQEKKQKTRPVVISGQDVSLDLLSKSLEGELSQTPLRLYNGSLNSLIDLYHGKCDIVSLHLYDGESDTYNLPYVKRLLVNDAYVVIHLVKRTAGLYVQKGNPHNIQCFKDIAEKDIKMVNRERGAGARVLLDEKLKQLGLSASHISGYHNIVTTHLAAASAVSSGKADVGIGIENVARMSDVEFIPLIEEQYDLVLLKQERTEEIIASIKKILSSESFQQQLLSLNGYKTDQTGEVLYESIL